MPRPPLVVPIRITSPRFAVSHRKVVLSICSDQTERTCVILRGTLRHVVQFVLTEPSAWEYACRTTSPRVTRREEAMTRGRSAARRRGHRTLITLAAGVVLATPVEARELPPACSAGRFVVVGKALFSGDTVVALEGDRVAIPGMCPDTAAEVVRKRGG